MPSTTKNTHLDWLGNTIVPPPAKKKQQQHNLLRMVDDMDFFYVFFVHSSGVPSAAAEIDHGAVDGLDSILVARPFLMVFSGSDKNWKVLPCRYH